MLIYSLTSKLYRFNLVLVTRVQIDAFNKIWDDGEFATSLVLRVSPDSHSFPFSLFAASL